MAKDARQVLQDIRLSLSQIPQRFRNAMRGREGKFANNTLRKLTRVPGKPSYPLRWKLERQRRAYFATNGFGRGIPTRRTGKGVRAWQTKVEDNAVLLTNPEEWIIYLQGPHTQPFHLDTGWVQTDDVADDFYKEAGDNAIEIFFEVGEGVIDGAF